jgi:hypothetical protein
MLNRLKRFSRCDAAAVTVDFVVLTSAILALNILAIVHFLEGGMVNVGDHLRTSILETTKDP